MRASRRATVRPAPARVLPVERGVGFADDIEEVAERAGDIEVFVEGGEEFRRRGRESGVAAGGASGGVIGEAGDPFVDARERGARGGKAVEGEVQREAVVDA